MTNDAVTASFDTQPSHSALNVDHHQEITQVNLTTGDASENVNSRGSIIAPQSKDLQIRFCVSNEPDASITSPPDVIPIQNSREILAQPTVEPAFEAHTTQPTETDEDAIERSDADPQPADSSPSAIRTPQSTKRPNAKSKRSQGHNAGQTARRRETSRMKKKVPQAMQMQWRIGAAPSAALTLSREERQMSRVLSSATTFHTSMFDTFWGPNITINQFIFDLDNRVEVFRDSTVTAACLVAIGKQHSAQEVLNKVLPGIDDLLRNPHPGLYLILAELALGLVKTPSNALQDQIRRYLSERARCILGSEHPISILLSLQLPQARKEALGERLWRDIMPVLAQRFGADHYQSSTQAFCHARNMAACGQPAEAVRNVEMLLERWGELYGNNSLIVCYAKIELANMLIAAGLPMKAEFVVSDALRISDMIHAAEMRNEDCPASEKRHRESSIAFPRVGGFRTLGRLHGLRGNFGAAAHYYSQAVAIGSNALGKHSAAVELAQNDLDSARELEIQNSREQFSTADLSKLSNIVATPVC